MEYTVLCYLALGFHSVFSLAKHKILGLLDIKVSLLFVWAGMTNFSMEYSSLTANKYQAVYVSPILSMIGIIKNTTFTRHTKGVILIDNTDNLQRNRAFLDKPVDYAIESNRSVS